MSRDRSCAGCYVLKTDMSKQDADTQTIHDRYCDLELVERAFRTMKTNHLDLRPVYVRKKSSTQGHVFVVMLALLIQRELERCWKNIDITVKEGIDELSGIHMQQITMGDTTVQNIPQPTKLGKKLLGDSKIILPSVLPARKPEIHTTKKLGSK